MTCHWSWIPSPIKESDIHDNIIQKVSWLHLHQRTVWKNIHIHVSLLCMGIKLSKLF